MVNFALPSRAHTITYLNASDVDVQAQRPLLRRFSALISCVLYHFAFAEPSPLSLDDLAPLFVVNRYLAVVHGYIELFLLFSVLRYRLDHRA